MGAIWGSFVGMLEQLLLFCAQLTGSVALGIILFTIIARVVILPLTISSLRSSRKMQEAQPLLKEVQRKYGKDQQKLQEETLRIYRENKINPVGGCLPIFLQLPIFFGVYQAVYHLMVEEQRVNLSAAAAAAFADPAVQLLFSTPFLGIDLGKATWGPPPLGFNGFEYLILPVLSILFQFAQQLMATPRVQDPQQKAMMQAMMFMPLIFGYIAFTFPSGAVLYWVTSSVVGVTQQYFTSGWGSLANYLRFLPADSRGFLTPAPALATAGVAPAAAVSGSSEPIVASENPHRDFWSIMRPLTELEVTNHDDHETSAQEEHRHQPRERSRRRKR